MKKISLIPFNKQKKSIKLSFTKSDIHIYSSFMDEGSASLEFVSTMLKRSTNIISKLFISSNGDKRLVELEVYPFKKENFYINKDEDRNIYRFYDNMKRNNRYCNIFILTLRNLINSKDTVDILIFVHLYHISDDPNNSFLVAEIEEIGLISDIKIEELNQKLLYEEKWFYSVITKRLEAIGKLDFVLENNLFEELEKQVRKMLEEKYVESIKEVEKFITEKVNGITKE